MIPLALTAFETWVLIPPWLLGVAVAGTWIAVKINDYLDGRER